MCGIVGYIGQGAVQDALVNGLEKLEYRGYDSAGIYVVDPAGRGHLFKEKGRIAALSEQVDFEIEASVGIGHTRWATHGVPSVDNAHPHQSANNRFTLVHNGVIENFRELKENYLSDVHLYGETDTEIVVNVIAAIAEKEGLGAKEALKKTLQVVKGSYAFAMIDAENPSVLYAAKNKSPLLIGLGDDFNMVQPY